MTFMIPYQYYKIDNLHVKMSRTGNSNVISLNAQSINAKYDSLLTLLEIAHKQNVTIHVMSKQKTWLDENCDLYLYKIEGYTCISHGKWRSSHGGLKTYVNSKLNTSVVDVKMVHRYGKASLLMLRKLI